MIYTLCIDTDMIPQFLQILPPKKSLQNLPQKIHPAPLFVKVPMAEAQDEVPKPSGPVSTARTVPAHRRPRAKGKSKAEAADWLSDAPYAGEEVLKHLETVDNGGPGTWDLERFDDSFGNWEVFFLVVYGGWGEVGIKELDWELQSHIFHRFSSGKFHNSSWLGNLVYGWSAGILFVLWNDQTWFLLSFG